MNKTIVGAHHLLQLAIRRQVKIEDCNTDWYTHRRPCQYLVWQSITIGWNRYTFHGKDYDGLPKRHNDVMVPPLVLVYVCNLAIGYQVFEWLRLGIDRGHLGFMVNDTVQVSLLCTNENHTMKVVNCLIIGNVSFTSTGIHKPSTTFQRYRLISDFLLQVHVIVFHLPSARIQCY